MIMLSLEENNRIKLSMPYHKQYIDQIKLIEGKAYDSGKKCWSFPCDKKTVDKIIFIFKDVKVNLHRSLIKNNVGQYAQKLLENKELKENEVLQTINELRLFGFSQGTIKAYKNQLVRFRKYLNKSIEEASLI